MSGGMQGAAGVPTSDGQRFVPGDGPKVALLTAHTRHEIDAWIARFPAGRQRSATLSALRFAQEQNQGFLTPDLMDAVAEYLRLPSIQVYEVATFYSMFNLQPVGRHVFEVCQTGPCMLKGCDDIIAHIRSRLGIGVGETTPDGLLTLKGVECLGACGYAPMMQLGKHYREHLTPGRVDAIIEECRNMSMA